MHSVAENTFVQSGARKQSLPPTEESLKSLCLLHHWFAFSPKTVKPYVCSRQTFCTLHCRVFCSLDFQSPVFHSFSNNCLILSLHC